MNALQAECRQDFDYDPITGILTKKSVVYANKTGRNSNGYLQLDWKGRPQVVHRLVWLWNYGNFPTMEIDHINGNRADNRLENLRDVSRSENQLNCRPSKEPLRYIVFRKTKGIQRYQVRFKRLGVDYHLGTFFSLANAIIARDEFLETLT